MAEAEEERTPTALEYMHRIGPDLLEQIVKVYRDNKFVADSDSLRPHGQQQTPVQAMLSVLPDTADHRTPAALFDYLDALVPEEEPTRTAFNKNWGRALPGIKFHENAPLPELSYGSESFTRKSISPVWSCGYVKKIKLYDLDRRTNSGATEDTTNQWLQTLQGGSTRVYSTGVGRLDKDKAATCKQHEQTSRTTLIASLALIASLPPLLSF